ncbi:4323_t:CDS:1, partial [Dentiscutata erythropus]
DYINKLLNQPLDSTIISYNAHTHQLSYQPLDQLLDLNSLDYIIPIISTIRLAIRLIYTHGINLNN